MCIGVSKSLTRSALIRGLSAKPRPELLKRLFLDLPKDLKEKLMRALVAGNL
jgi:hypothetical protein